MSSISSAILTGDALTVLGALPAASVQCCVTSPPYWGVRDYGIPGQLGAEKTPQEYVDRLVGIIAGVRRVLREDGVLWLNLGDCYANDTKWGGSTSGKHRTSLHGQTGVGRAKRTTGLPAKSLVGVPWRVALALQADGWTLRSDVVWHKPHPMPEKTPDRPHRGHEYVFLFSRGPRYFYTVEPRSRWNVWTIPTRSDPDHPAAFPSELAERCIVAGSRVGDVVLDPFAGSGTTCAVADAHQRKYIGIELNPEYAESARQRIVKDGAPLFSRMSAQ